MPHSPQAYLAGVWISDQAAQFVEAVLDALAFGGDQPELLAPAKRTG